jgi:hypothetical protein
LIVKVSPATVLWLSPSASEPVLRNYIDFPAKTRKPGVLTADRS